MKVTSIETAVLHVPCPRPMSLEFPDHRMVAAFIDTDVGVRGFGYTLAFGGGGAGGHPGLSRDAPQAAAHGRGPTWWASCGRRCSAPIAGSAGWGLPDMRSPRSTSRCGTSPARSPTSRWPHVGAVTDRVAAYGSGGWGTYTVNDLVAEAKRYAGDGVPVLQAEDPRRRPPREWERVEAVKKALGDAVRLMVDVNQKLDVRAPSDRRSCWRTSTSSGTRSLFSPMTSRPAQKWPAPSRFP